MTDRDFLESYTGQSVEELLALERTHRIDSLVLAFEQAIQEKADREGDASLTTVDMTVLAVEALEREVNNGGYDQFFVNTMRFAPVIVEALRRIDCPQVAVITEDAIAALRLPVLSEAGIEMVIYDADDERDAALGECDDRYFQHPEPIADRLFAFIKANASRIKL